MSMYILTRKFSAQQFLHYRLKFHNKKIEVRKQCKDQTYPLQIMNRFSSLTLTVYTASLSAVWKLGEFLLKSSEVEGSVNRKMKSCWIRLSRIFGFDAPSAVPPPPPLSTPAHHKKRRRWKK